MSKLRVSVRVSIVPVGQDAYQQGLSIEETAEIEPMDFFSVCKLLGWFNDLINEIRKGKRP
jgi:hypothetical protein